MKTKTNLLKRSLDYLASEGWVCQKVERWEPYTMRMIDFFGCIDAICCRPGEVLGVQTTNAGNASNHRRKINDEPRTKVWLEAGAQLKLHSWRKVGARWQLKEEDIKLVTVP